MAAVAAAGTDYCDLTGETQWMRRMIDAHQATAEASGARVLHACGFDSIPSDLGVWFTQQHALERFGEACDRIAMRVHRTKGGASGGTIPWCAQALLTERRRAVQSGEPWVFEIVPVDAAVLSGAQILAPGAARRVVDTTLTLAATEPTASPASIAGWAAAVGSDTLAGS